MAVPIQNLRSGVASKRPVATGLAVGEIAINYNEEDPAIYLRGNADALVKVAPVYVATGAPNATPASGGASGNTIGEQWLDKSVTPPVQKVWDGSTWVPSFAIGAGAITNTEVNASAAIAYSKLALSDSIVDADINTSAAISLSKLATGSLPSGITVASSNIVDGTIVDADINASAAIGLDKLATGTLPSGITVASSNIVDGTIVNADINASAAIALSKLATGALPSAITVNSDNIVDGSIVDGDISISASISLGKLDTGALPVGITVTSGNVADSSILTSASIGNTVQAYDVDTAKLDVAQTFTAGQTLEADLTINSQNELRFADTDNSNYVALQAPSTVAANVLWTLPAADGANGQVLSTNGAGILAFSTIEAGGSLNVAAKSANYTAVAGDKSYLFNCTGTWTLSLTDAATLGNGWYLFINNLGTGQITVDPNGAELIGGATTAVLKPGDFWLIACDGSGFALNRLAGNNYQIFTSSGNFTVPAGVRRIYVQAWGGGGGGGKSDTSGQPAAGGGSGAYSAQWLDVSPAQQISVTIGAGGLGATSSNGTGGDGGDTLFGTGPLVAARGGRGSVAGVLFTATSSFAEGGGESSPQADVNIKGQAGSAALLNAFSSSWITFGGSAPLGGTGGFGGNVNGSDGNNYFPSEPGGGGAGGVLQSPPRDGQSGAKGRIIVYWI